MMLILGVSFYHFIGDSHITGGMAWLLVVVCTLLASVIGFLIAAACGYIGFFKNSLKAFESLL